VNLPNAEKQFMKQRVWAVAIAACVILALVCGNAVLLWIQLSLENKLKESRALASTMRDELGRLREEKEKIAKDNEKLSADSGTYLSLNSNLQKEKESLEQKNIEFEKKEKKLQSELEKLQEHVRVAEKKLAETKEKKKEPDTEEPARSSIKGPAAAQTPQNDEALFKYNQGVFLAKWELYDTAINSYLQSIQIQPNNPDAHYNLALLYWKHKKDFQSASHHFSEYLKLKPKAEDRTEVQGWIDSLTEYNNL
jgi:tetratricopeptide (TPR) repeat protein